jgi:hypothetical protein
MAKPHTVGELRDLLRNLRREIERLESIGHYPNPRGKATRKRIDEAKIQEVVLLAKLAELETKQ